MGLRIQEENEEWGGDETRRTRLLTMWGGGRPTDEADRRSTDELRLRDVGRRAAVEGPTPTMGSGRRKPRISKGRRPTAAGEGAERPASTWSLNRTRAR
ncbi:hypothetical protein AXF42_Ash000553 [Apostasia shenzhenica]|uniref:Uncharacterized protein n=1 Tax=Apostasia shenzhenica TaxID=1088818 RepID=A0A2I0AGQ6_9ASPA|nr:hypothetical protein AXF42_Ash000553 [Apostasia shenzhenica]